MTVILPSDEMTPFQSEKAIAVALSGGPDSMALAYLLALWSKENKGPKIYALTVDHGLRAESADEAALVGKWVKSWPQVTHHILRWEGDKPGARILEEARRARYRLMTDFCHQKNISHLFLAHHQDDQAETFLIRLVGGSGLDGLTGMKKIQEIPHGPFLVRPLLDQPKTALVEFCQGNSIPFVEDPSNYKLSFLRPRLRAAREVLEQEGLTSKRLAVTASRMARAREALEYFAEQAWTECLKRNSSPGDVFYFDLPRLNTWPDEIALRVILKAMKILRGEEDDYGPRREKVESLQKVIKKPGGINQRTLGRCVFAIEEKGTVLSIAKETLH